MDQLKDGLKSFLESKNFKRDEERVTKQEIEEFHRLFPKAAPSKETAVAAAAAATSASASTLHIPKFFNPLPKEDDLLQQRLREEARALFLQKKNKELLSNDELESLRTLLEQNITRPMVGDDIMIDYKNFRKVGRLVGAKCNNKEHHL